MKNQLLILSAVYCLSACSSSSTQETTVDPEEVVNNETEWSIPIEDVLDGGPGRDGIPALENPSFVNADQSAILLDSDLVIGYKNGDDVRAYQHIVLDWHEIINDNVGSESLAIVYCPLTGTGIGWNRIIDGNETSFGVSGLLYQTNLVPFDRATKSNWSQLLNEAVNGSLIGKKAELITLFETDWKTWKAMYPETKIVSLNTGFSRTYGVYPYVDYRTNNNFFIFPTPKDDRLPSKERVLAILDGEKAKAYRFSDFETTNLIKDTFNGQPYLLVGNENFMAAFRLSASQESVDFEYVFDGTSGVVVEGADGTRFDVFGNSVTGIGGALEPATSLMGYWFSFPAFYETELYAN